MIDEDKIRYILLSIIIILELIVIGFLVFDNDTKECISNNEVVPVLEEKEDLDMFFDKAKREQSKMALKGLSKYEEKLVDKIKKDL